MASSRYAGMVWGSTVRNSLALDKKACASAKVVREATCQDFGIVDALSYQNTITVIGLIVHQNRQPKDQQTNISYGEPAKGAVAFETSLAVGSSS